MKRPAWVEPAACLLVAASLAWVGCGPSDPRASVLEQRARWDVQALGWVENPDGTINFSTRVSGPPNSKIDQLTVAIDLAGAGGGSGKRVWHTFDLTEIQRGGPKDVVIRVDPDGVAVDSVGLALVSNPTPEEEPFIRELQGL